MVRAFQHLLTRFLSFRPPPLWRGEGFSISLNTCEGMLNQVQHDSVGYFQGAKVIKEALVARFLTLYILISSKIPFSK